MKRLAFALIALLFAQTDALAQSSPNFSYGQVPTAKQWNDAFAGKQDRLTFAPLNPAGGTMQGRLQTAPSTVNAAGLSILPGTAPNAPSNGDLWATTVGLYGRFGGRTLALAGLDQSTGSFLVPGGPTIGTYQSGQFTSQPYSIQIGAGGATGPVDGASVTANGLTRTLAAVAQLGGGSTTVPVTGGTITLTPAQLAGGNINLTGTLVSTLTVQFPPNIPGSWLVTNSTSGAYATSAKVVGQSAAAIPILQGLARQVGSDGTTLNSPLAATVTGQTPVIVDNIVCWANTSGTAVKDCGVAPGSSGHALAALDVANTWSAAQTFSGSMLMTNSVAPAYRLGATGSHVFQFGANAALAGAGQPGVGIYDETSGVWIIASPQATGNVGIGTTTPRAKLEVAGSIMGQPLPIAGTIPTTTELPSGYAVTKSSSDYLIRLCVNDGGTPRCQTGF